MSKTELKDNLVPVDKNNINKIMEDCEIYREKLIQHCQLHFQLGYEDARDCVQDTYVALYENLLRGIKISNYRAWLYQVTMNYNNKIIRDKLKRNEYDFLNNEDKDKAIENNLYYNPDYVDNMVTDETIEKRAVKIVSSLNKDEQNLYIAHYWKQQSFVEISKSLGLDSSTVGKRHAKLKKKILKMIKDYEKS
ncbi:RNA polymerase sigma factor [uncultured Eubacterium sp.]|uniref:RNA polymerase sigma factor n=1 Tax=uncultured Eubacterium sp. TaxID=165185 RepID=UPI002634160C|nr:sigma-70 family RNA polymerase sigma factor [uncultured Eubacterium sp.]